MSSSVADGPRLTSTLFDPRHHRADHFASGERALDDWLREHSAASARARVAQTFVWVDDHDDVLAYYAISAHSVRRAEAPSRVGRGVPDPVPAALIAKLALDRSLRGRQLGAVLAADAIARIIHASRTGPAVRAVVVDASTDNGRRLYESLGFTAHPPGTSRMIARAESLEVAVARLGNPGST